MNAKGLGMVTPKIGAMTPRFSCAECGEPITDARRAGVVWKGEDLLFNSGLWSGKLRTAIREQHGVETARGER